jgi:predicted DNA-binding ArsR family transcriptional regulator
MKSIELKELSPFIEFVIKKKGSSYSEVGRVLNKSPQYIRQVIKGQEDKNIKAKLKILQVLGVNATQEKKVTINIF